MALTINTNVASLNAQRNLSRSQGDLSTAMARLSSGLRINSAKDDAAGLAISDRMTSQIRGLDQATRNANDGISLAQTAEGAMQESTNILQRIRELAVQSANSTNSTTDRQSLQAEVVQLQSELNRIATSTTFNGLTILNGNYTSQNFQVGPNAGNTIAFGIDSVKTNSIGHIAEGTSDVAVNGSVATGLTLTVGATGVALPVGSSNDFAISGDTYHDGTSAYAKAAAINAAGVFGLLATTSTQGASAALGATVSSVGTSTLVAAGSAAIPASIASQNVTITSATSGAASDFTVVYNDDNNATVTAGWDNSTRTLTINGDWDASVGAITSTTSDLATAISNAATPDLSVSGGDTTLVTNSAGSTTTTNGADAVAGQATITLTNVQAATVNSVDIKVGGTALTGVDWTTVSDGTTLAAALTTAAAAMTPPLDLTASYASGTLTLDTTGASGALAINSSGNGTLSDSVATGVIASNSSTTSDGTYSLTINGVPITATIPKNNGTTDGVLNGSELASVINTASSKTGVTASYNTTDNTLHLTATDGRNIVLTNEAVSGGTSTLTYPVDSGELAGDANGVLRGKISLTAVDAITIGGTTSTIGFNNANIAVNTVQGVNVIDISTIDGANKAMLRVDSAIASVDASRASLGAIQNRFESTIANLQNVAENLTAARSRVTDADIAQETSEMTKNNILQQAGVSILAQANQIPQLALKLLQG